MLGIWYIVAVTQIQIADSFQNGIYVVFSRSNNPFRCLDIPSSADNNNNAYEGNTVTTTTTRRQSFLLFSTRTTSSSSLSTDASLLEGKLSILQDVVKEMDTRQKQIQEKSETAEKDYEEKLYNLGKEIDESEKTTGIQDEKIQSLKNELDDMEDQHISDLERLETRKDREYKEQSKELSALASDRLDKIKIEYDHRTSQLQSRLEAKEKEIDELSSEFTTKSKETKDIIEALRARGQIAIAKQQEEQREIKTEDVLRTEMKENEESQRAAKEIEIDILKASHQKIVEEYKIKIEELSSERDDMSAELDAISTKSDEQVEIATAAVKAGQKREETIQEKSDDIAKQLQRSRLQVKIMRMAMEGISDENRELLSQKETLKHTLDIARDGIAELENEKSKSLWQKLRTRVSRTKY